MSETMDRLAEAARTACRRANLRGDDVACFEVDWPGQPGVIALGCVMADGRFSAVPTDADQWAVLCKHFPARADEIRAAAVVNLRNSRPPRSGAGLHLLPEARTNGYDHGVNTDRMEP